MTVADRTALPALLLAAALFVLALPRPRPDPEPCPAPREQASRAGHSVAVVCGIAGESRAATPGRELRGPARLLFDLALDLNQASALTLEALPGIGPVRAQAILRERERRPFASVRELLRVPGIGPRTLERLAPFVSVGPDDGASLAGPPVPASERSVGCRGSCGEDSM